MRISAEYSLLAVWFILLFTVHVSAQQTVLVDDFARADSLYHGDGWETVNPGCWKIENHALRRRLRNRGDWGASLEFPFRALLDGPQPAVAKLPLPRPYGPALPVAMIWKRDWKLQGNYTIRIDATVRALPPVIEERKNDPDYAPAYSLMGIGFGSRSLLESWSVGKAKTAAWMALWRGDGRFGIYSHATDGPETAAERSEKTSLSLQPGETVRIEFEVSGVNPEKATVTARFGARSRETIVQCLNVNREEYTEGYFGLVGRGLLDFEVNRVALVPLKNQPTQVPVNDLHVCYPLGDTLRKVDSSWHCTFIAMFRSDGGRVQIRVADKPQPQSEWKTVPAAGSADIISNHFRLNTASIPVELPHDPGETTMYYTVWRDGLDVTPDPRTGWLGKKNYVGRLPQLSAPYRLCGLGGHAITGPANMPETYKFGTNWVRGQPTPEAYPHFEQYDFQILNWEDDVLFSTIDGRPIRGTRSLADGSVPLRGLIEIDGKDIIPGTHLRMTAFDGKNLDARIIETKPVDRNILRAFRANIERLEQQAEAEYKGWIQDYQKSKGTKQ